MNQHTVKEKLNGHLRLQQELSEGDIEEICLYLDTLLKAMDWVSENSPMNQILKKECLEHVWPAEFPRGSRRKFVSFDLSEQDRIISFYKRRKKGNADGPK